MIEEKEKKEALNCGRYSEEGGLKLPKDMSYPIRKDSRGEGSSAGPGGSTAASHVPALAGAELTLPHASSQLYAPPYLLAIFCV